MCRRRPNALFRGPPDPVLVHYSVSGDGINRVAYIVCLHGWVPERCELWSLIEHGGREVHPFPRIRLLNHFRADTFQTTFFNSQRCRIFFIGQRLLNASVEFIDFADVTSDTKGVISTPNIFFTNGLSILSLSGLLSPITLAARTSLSLFRKCSVRGAITSVWDLSGLRGN